ncbi:hypothetical protein [Herbidospora sp. RD11066]
MTDEEVEPVWPCGVVHFARGAIAGEATGVVKGKLAALLAILEVRGLTLDKEKYGWVEEYGGDPEEMLGWIKRAVVVDDVDDLFRHFSGPASLYRRCPHRH